MHSESRQKIIKSVYRMLLELANGNLAYRIAADASDQQFNAIAKALNAVAERMQLANYQNPYPMSIPLPKGDDPTTLIVQQVKDYILNHLEEPLPSARELAKMFSTNEFALKESFRSLFHTSIYQFYNDERLQKAHFLIEHTPILLKEISFICGFNDYTVFFKAFKKKYHYTHSDIKRMPTPEKPG